jgi:hypothetical protein
MCPMRDCEGATMERYLAIGRTEEPSDLSDLSDLLVAIVWSDGPAIYLELRDTELARDSLYQAYHSQDRFTIVYGPEGSAPGKPKRTATFTLPDFGLGEGSPYLTQTLHRQGDIVDGVFD